MDVLTRDELKKYDTPIDRPLKIDDCLGDVVLEEPFLRPVPYWLVEDETFAGYLVGVFGKNRIGPQYLLAIVITDINEWQNAVSAANEYLAKMWPERRIS